MSDQSEIEEKKSQSFPFQVFKIILINGILQLSSQTSKPLLILREHKE
jgi:hypothetical protein